METLEKHYFNKNGNLLIIESSDGNNFDIIEEYEYNDKNQLIYHKLKNSIHKMFYNNSNQLIKKSVYNLENELKIEIELKYDEKNNLIEEIFYSDSIENSSYSSLNIKYEYNENNQRISKTTTESKDIFTYYPNGLLHKKIYPLENLTIVNEYNDKNLLSQQNIYYTANQTIIDSNIHTNYNVIEFKYDQFNNLIYKKDFEFDDELIIQNFYPDNFNPNLEIDEYLENYNLDL